MKTNEFMKVSITAILIAFALTAEAQWSTPDAQGRIYYNGNVGIGPVIPTFGKLQVSQTADGSDQGIAVLNSSGVRAMRLWADANNSYVYSGASGQANLILNGSGNVGIGTLSPDYKLHIVDGNGGAQLKFQRGIGIATIAQGNNVNNLYIDASAGLMLNYNGGNVGIGAVTPWHKLHVVGTAGDSNTGVVRIEAAGSNANLRIGMNTDYAWIQSHNSRPLYLNELGNNTILNALGGNVGIGTASPTANLDISGDNADLSILKLRNATWACNQRTAIEFWNGGLKFSYKQDCLPNGWVWSRGRSSYI